VKVLVLVVEVDAPAVVDADAGEAVVTGALEPAVGEVLEQLLDRLGCPVREHSKIAFAGHARVDRIRAIERPSVLARLDVLEPVGHLRLTDAEPEFLLRIAEHVAIPVAHLRVRSRELGLRIDRQERRDISGEHEACAADRVSKPSRDDLACERDR
jgi:hypothetical protein